MPHAMPHAILADSAVKGLFKRIFVRIYINKHSGFHSLNARGKGKKNYHIHYQMQGRICHFWKTLDIYPRQNNIIPIAYFTGGMR